MNIGYVRSAFPKMSETFILEELLYLKRCGHKLRIYAAACELSHLNPKILTAGLLQCVEYHVLAFRFGVADFKVILRFLLALLFKRQARSHFRLRIYDEFTTTQMFHFLWSQAGPPQEGGGRISFKSGMRLIGELAWNCIRLGNLQLAIHQATIRRIPFKPDILHAPFLFTNDVAWLALLLKIHPLVPFTVTLRSRDLYSQSVSSELMQARKRLVAAARQVFTISTFNVQHILRTVKLRKPPLVIYSSIDISYFSRAHASIPITGQLLCVARLVEKKGLNVLIDACQELVKRGCDFHLTMVGAGDLLEQLLIQRERLELERFITFTGAVPPTGVKELLNTAQIFVLPCVVAADGDRDMLPNSIKEAMAMEVPVVTSDISGIEELVTHGANGLLTEPNNPQALADALEQLLRNPRACRILGTWGGIVARKKFDINIQGGMLEKKLIDIVEQRK